MRNKKKVLICAAIIVFLGSLFLVIHGLNPKELVITENELVVFDDTDYELWKDDGDVEMTVKEEGSFACEWHDTHNVVFRAGQKFDSTQLVSSFGEINLDYGADYHPDGHSYLCVYGWTKEPLAEFYIVENWGDTLPGDKRKGFDEWTYLGTHTIDGVEYKVYSSPRENKPSIEGDNTSFTQYWSIRKDRSSEGTVDISDHFKIWESEGLSLGYLYELSFAVEGVASSGYADIYQNDLSWSLLPD